MAKGGGRREERGERREEKGKERGEGKGGRREESGERREDREERGQGGGRRRGGCMVSNAKFAPVNLPREHLVGFPLTPPPN